MKQWFILGWMLAIEPISVAYSQERTVDFAKDVYPLLKSRCFECHQGRNPAAVVRLDQRAEWLGETNGRSLAVPGDSAKSLVIDLLTEKAPGKFMPKKGPRLSADQIALVRAWIDQGMPWDDKLLPPDFVHADHWAFQPVRRPPLPKVRRVGHVESPIDAFILARQEKDGITPAPRADRVTLIRRLSLDLLGMPPTYEEVQAFVQDSSPDAYQKIVERMLASPHYGERWARHWLDVARWAESEGYESNHPRPYAWRYRDWVVDAFNADMPFADFVRAQLAGDEIEPYSDRNLIATGFLAAARLSSNEEDRPRQRNDIHVDIVNTTAATFLGLTFQCAQCHNHKFDPFSARDYYRLQGFFVQGQPSNFALADPALWQQYHAKKPVAYDAAAAERDRLYELGRARKSAEVEKSLSAETLAIYRMPREKRSAEQEKSARQTDLLFQFSTGQIERGLNAEETKRYNDLKKQLAEMEKGMPEVPQTWAFVAPRGGAKGPRWLPMKGFYPLAYEPEELRRARPYLLTAGDVHRPSFEVDTGWPALFGPTPSKSTADRPRLALADWIANPSNPLSGRVYVNRIWQHHFGKGLVATPNDFGVKGTEPTHPELLDWLASEWMRLGGSTKGLHRLIVLSRTYQQASRGEAANTAKDPENETLWRWPIRRLEAEAIRDSWLTVSGELDRAVGGPSQANDDKIRRRSLYLTQKRDVPPPHQALFDGPSAMTESCGKRQMTMVPLQPLYLLNSGFSMARAKSFAERVRDKAGDDVNEQITVAYRLALGRSPTLAEQTIVRRFFERETALPSGDAPATSLVLFCQTLCNSNEFLYVP